MENFFIYCACVCHPSSSLFLESNEEKKKKNEEETKSVTKVNEQNKDNGGLRNANDAPKNLLIDLSNETKTAGNSWVGVLS